LNEFGSIEKIIITNSGQNYSVATVNIIDSTGLNASVRPILSPLGGHGSNAIKELYSSRLMFSTELKNTLFFGHKVSNDFRQFGIIKTPLKPDGTFLNSDIPVNCYSTATITNYSIDKFPEDSILYTWNNGIDKRFTIISREVTVDGFKLLLLPMDKAEPNYLYLQIHILLLEMLLNQIWIVFLVIYYIQIIEHLFTNRKNN
jgi:hypothetical protein